jgi:hypothetical protein
MRKIITWCRAHTVHILGRRDAYSFLFVLAFEKSYNRMNTEPPLSESNRHCSKITVEWISLLLTNKTKQNPS